MIFRKTVTTALIVSQMGLFALSPAFADSNTSTQSVSPEAALLQNVMALRGSALSKDALQTQLSAAISDYTAAAPAQNRDERLEQALVQMKIMTPQQISVLTQQIGNDMGTQASATSGELSTAAQTELQSLLTTPPAGAQFSLCRTTTIVFASTWIAAMAFTIAGKVENDNQALYKTAITMIIIGFVSGLIGYGGSC